MTAAQIAEGRRICDIVCVQTHYNLAHRADDGLVTPVNSGASRERRLCKHQRQAEEIESKPAFREAFQRERWLVPVDNFYE